MIKCKIYPSPGPWIKWHDKLGTSKIYKSSCFKRLKLLLIHEAVITVVHNHCILSRCSCPPQQVSCFFILYALTTSQPHVSCQAIYLPFSSRNECNWEMEVCVSIFWASTPSFSFKLFSIFRSYLIQSILAGFRV